jgi:hypothetical protein
VCTNDYEPYIFTHDDAADYMTCQALRANIWKLHVILACRWFLLLMPVLVLFYQENGLSL